MIMKFIIKWIRLNVIKLNKIKLSIEEELKLFFGVINMLFFLLSYVLCKFS